MNYLTYFILFLIANNTALQEITPPKPGKVPLGPSQRPKYEELDENLADLEEISTDVSECDAKCDLGDEILIDYEMKLENEVLLDSSFRRKTPLRIRLGATNILEGWTRGMVGMCVGESKKLKIPPHLAYGDEDIDSVPKNSVILVEVKLLEILEKQEERDVFREIDVNGDNEISAEEMVSYLDWVDLKHGVQERSKNEQILFTQQLFEIEDQDKNGVISIKEYLDDVDDEGFISVLYRTASENYIKMKENAKIRDQIYEEWKNKKNS